MDSIERAIRGALDKGDADDRAFREKVYRSVFAALERNIAANPALDADAAQRRRELLKARITEIEQEFVPAVEAEPAAAPATSAPAVAPAIEASARGPRVAMPGERREPSFGDYEPAVEPEGHPVREEAPDFGDRATETDFAGAPEMDREVLAGRELPEQRARRGALLFVAVALLAAIAIGGWLATELGLVNWQRVAQQQPPASEGENFDPDTPHPALGPGTADASRDWVTVFSPADPVSVVAPADARADIMDDEGTAFIRIRSGAAGQAVLFDVGQGMLERLAGHRAVFNVVARAVDDHETQISIDCNFGELGDCGRRRYMVGAGRGDYLFDIELPDAQPGAAGSIAIVSDVDGAGKAIDIFEIKVSIGD